MDREVVAGAIPRGVWMWPPDPGRARARRPAGSVPVYVRMCPPGGTRGEAQEGQRRPAGRQRTEPAGWKEKEREAA